MKIPIVLFLKGCVIASFFISCQQQSTPAPQPEEVHKKPALYEASELALLMRALYEQQLEIKKGLQTGELPDSISPDFVNIHTAVATKNMIDQRPTFEAMATTFVAQMHALTKAQNVDSAKVIFNNIIGTCSSCHQVYCQGPLQKIKKLKLPHETATDPN
jgi:cytochrome c553